jgi:hypothetical protein
VWLGFWHEHTCLVKCSILLQKAENDCWHLYYYFTGLL